MTKPPGSLGVLEDVAAQLAGIAGECPPPPPSPASAALICAFTGASPAEATGRGTGVDDPTLARKVDVVTRAVARLTDRSDALAVLAEVGGLEHAAIAGFVLGAAAARTPVLLDGV